MRRLSLLILLATAAAPALAADDNDRRGRGNRDSASEQSENRSQRSESRSQRSERAAARQQSQSEERRYGAQRSDRAQPAEQGTTESIRERIQQRQEALSDRSGSDAPVRNLRRRDRQEATETQSTWQPRQRRIRTIPDNQPSATTSGRRGEIARAFEGRQRRDYRDGNYRRWSSDWHRDRRYDWRRWRDRHRSIFRLGFYYDPFGWNYRRWSIGSFLYPSYYGSRYWLNDPFHYRLPPAYGPYRWVRYWDDALLVNIYTGEVVEVMHNFFW